MSAAPQDPAPHPGLAGGPVHLDYNATTPVDPRVVAAMAPHLSTMFGNPSTSHEYAEGPRAALAEARAAVAVLVSIMAANNETGALQPVAALYVRRGVSLEPVVYGGGQERGLRAGTENVAQAVALGEAAHEIGASTGSACHSGSHTPSPVLTAMGLPDRGALGAMRLLLGRWTTGAAEAPSEQGQAIGVRHVGDEALAQIDRLLGD